MNNRLRAAAPCLRWGVAVALVMAAVSVAADGDCDAVLAVERQGTIWLWHARDGERELVQGGCAALERGARRLAYCTPADAMGQPGRELHVRRLDGTHPEWVHRAGEGAFISEAAWSPEGGRLAFIETDRDYRSHLMLWSPGGPARRVASAPGSTSHLWWSLGWIADGSALTVHDMTVLQRIALDGRAPDSIPLPELIGAGLETVTSTDRVLPAPHDPTVFAYTRLVPGSALFSRVMHEPNSALFVHDRFLGRGKNLRLTAEAVTVLDVAWTPDGRSLHFAGYLDIHAADEDPFRIYRIDRNGRGLRALLRGERVSVACREPASREAIK